MTLGRWCLLLSVFSQGNFPSSEVGYGGGSVPLAENSWIGLLALFSSTLYVVLTQPDLCPTFPGQIEPLAFFCSPLHLPVCLLATALLAFCPSRYFHQPFWSRWGWEMVSAVVGLSQFPFLNGIGRGCSRLLCFSVFPVSKGQELPSVLAMH